MFRLNVTQTIGTRLLSCELTLITKFTFGISSAIDMLKEVMCRRKMLNAFCTVPSRHAKC
jgi:hypothetical protein